MSDDGVPRVEISEVAKSVVDLHLKLFSGELPLPCWLVIGDAAHKVTEANRRDLARGILLYLEARAHLEGG